VEYKIQSGHAATANAAMTFTPHQVAGNSIQKEKYHAQ